MNLVKIKKRFTSKKLLCKIFGHKIKTSRKITNHFKEYKCTVCNLELTNDDNGELTYLTPELKKINEALVRFHKKRAS